MDGGAAKGVFSAQTQEEIASRDEALLEAYLEGEADEAAFVSAARREVSSVTVSSSCSAVTSSQS